MDDSGRLVWHKPATWHMRGTHLRHEGQGSIDALKGPIFLEQKMGEQASPPKWQGLALSGLWVRSSKGVWHADLG